MPQPPCLPTSSVPQAAIARPEFIDTHAHLATPGRGAGIIEVLDRATAAGVVQVVTVGTTAQDSRLCVGIAQRFGGLFAAVGIHPNDAAEAADDDWSQIRELVAEPKVVALGETGLDRHWDRTPFPIQQEYFDRHLALGRELGLPVIIHCRNCEADIIRQLERQGRPTLGVLHSFTGTLDDARAFLELGLDLSFAGMVTFASKALEPLRAVAAEVPLDRLLIETDSPYLSPHPFRGRPNEPARVAVTAEVLARVRGLPLPELARATTANARRLFRLPDVAVTPTPPVA